MANTVDQCFVDDQTGHLMILANDLLQACNGVMDGEGTVPIEMYTVSTTDGNQTENIKRANDLLEACNGVMDGKGTVPIEMYTVNTTDGSQTENNIKSEQKHEEVQIGAVLDRAGDVLNGDGNAANSSLFSEQVDALIKADAVLDNSAEVLENEITADGTPRRSKKRLRQPELWQRVIQKKQRQSGKEYVNSKGVTIPSKIVETVDCSKCCHKCSSKINEPDRNIIFEHFWSLSDQAKSAFYGKFTERIGKKRKRTRNEASKHSREFTILYYLQSQGTRYRVCKKFFLGTLGISQTRIFYFYSKLTSGDSGVPKERSQGQHCKYRVPDNLTDVVRKHIESFPTVESHYAREKTSRLYLERNLNTTLMYELYKEQCEEKGIGYVKAHKYRQIFNEEYNIAFIKPKTDRCDACEKHKLDLEKNVSLTEEEFQHIERHQFLKEDARTERNLDRANGTAVLCFDMENVITLPRANVSNFYYKRKLSVYNLTIHSSLDKAVYCCIWNETESGRGGNSIASALLKGLDKFVQAHPNVCKLILWSDSCVPQNRNSMMSYALMSFMLKYPHLEEIRQKYSESGHSLIQEVDSAHSAIERHLQRCEVYSPVSLIRQLVAIRRDPKLKIIQLKHNDFLNFDGVKQMKFNKVPYSAVKQLAYKKDLPNFISFKDCHNSEKEMSCVSILKEKRSQRGVKLIPPQRVEPLSSLKTLKAPGALSKEKIDDLQSMIPYMPALDADYMQTLLKAPLKTPQKTPKSSLK